MAELKIKTYIQTEGQTGQALNIDETIMEVNIWLPIKLYQKTKEAPPNEAYLSYSYIFTNLFQPKDISTIYIHLSTNLNLMHNLTWYF